jgi:stage II sporulation protein AB (anti-sigma F factor)
MKEKNVFKAEFPSRSANEGFARAAVGAFVSQLDPTMDELGDIKTAVSEAVTNCIVHAYPDTYGTIKLKVRISDDGEVEITVKDKGVGIEDVERAMTPILPPAATTAAAWASPSSTALWTACG